MSFWGVGLLNSLILARLHKILGHYSDKVALDLLDDLLLLQSGRPRQDCYRSHEIGQDCEALVRLLRIVGLRVPENDLFLTFAVNLDRHYKEDVPEEEF